MTQSKAAIIQANPIGDHLDAIRTLLNAYESLDTIDNKNLKELNSRLFSTINSLGATYLLPSKARGKNLAEDVLTLISTVNSDHFDFDRTKPLLKTILAGKPDQEIWEQVYNAVTEATPPLQSNESIQDQTPVAHNTSGIVNSSERRKDIDKLLKRELGMIYVDVPEFYEKFFGGVAKLKTTSQSFFEKCNKGMDPSFCEGWTGWPIHAQERDVLEWLTEFIEKLAAFVQEDHRSISTRRTTISQPNKPLSGSTSKRKLDIGFVNKTKEDTECNWSHILIPGELKSNPTADTQETWLDLGRYVREIFAAQDTRRFVLGFTLCGSFMRIWEFDRLGGIASKKFDINKEGLRFVSTILGFLWMDEQDLGFDPTIKTANNQRFIEIERENQKERLIIDKVMIRTRCIAGRATTCWKAHDEQNPSIPLVIKDSWQYLERDDEGKLLSEATRRGVVHVSRYHHHETIRILDMEDDILGNVRKGLDITKASNYSRKDPFVSRNRGSVGPFSNTGRKRSSSQINTLMPPPPSKRSRSKSSSASPAKIATGKESNRVHRRVVLCDYGAPIYTASSRIALLAALEGCITGHESLHNAGLLHRDISINNLMINEDESNPSPPSFLIDLDLAIDKSRQYSSGAKEKTGTRVFMAIGILLGEQHTFMHDLESFFWVLFWICIHYDKPSKESIAPTKFDDWNYQNDDTLAQLKKATVFDEQDFLQAVEQDFTPYYKPLIPWVNELRKVVFPDDRRHKKLDPHLYSSMKKILRDAQESQKKMGDLQSYSLFA
ncbi:hypothetical protein DSL72_003092 [Monilinia vaccinii-corymbosi]|uniref:non-specific serine/threonine protein kinase n=1 Tax=Monilinia vaccinii-corymbosi TaxID=61207 RepID=A0A8A3NT14_9HELO|nr:hypothetical protein DSL72_003092 [Monilinia vaccinii-corymbosi]